MTPLATAPGIVESYIYATLTADATLMALVTGVYATIAPQGATYPLLVFASTGGKDVQAFGPIRTMSQQFYAIKSIADQASIGVLDQIMARVDADLQGKQAVTPTGYILGCRREMTAVLGVPDAGIQYRQMVYTYRFYAQEGHG